MYFYYSMKGEKFSGNGDGPVSRISVSLPQDVRAELDELIERRGFESRSQAVTSMIRESALEARGEMGSTVMAGTITLFYSQRKPALLAELAGIKRRSIDEVIGSLQVQLERDHIMEVILVQGPACQLKQIAEDLISRKGVKSGKLTLTSAIMPPIHPLAGKA